MEEVEWDTSLVPKRRHRLGYSYPSHQTRNGPAPLASFEDLPSDDQNSPDCVSIPDLEPDSEAAIDEALAGDPHLLLRNPASDQTTPVNEDPVCASTATLTDLREAPIKPRSLVTDTGLSLMRRKSSPIPGKHSLTASREGASPTPDVKRKSSWTDVLFRRRSRSRSPVDVPDASQHPMEVRAKPEKKKKGVFAIFNKNKRGSRDSVKNAGCESASRPQLLQTPVLPVSQSKGSPEDRRIAWETLRLPRLSIT